MKPDVAMKLINTKYRTPSPHQFFASGRFDVIAADVSFRDIKRRGEWNEGGGREREEGRMCARARACAEIRFAWTTIHSEEHLRGRVSADSKAVFREIESKLSTRNFDRPHIKMTN